MTIQTAIAEACPVLGLVAPASVTSTIDANATRLLAVAHEAGEDIAKRGDWRRMLSKTTATSGPITLPADFERLVPGGAINITLPAVSPVRGPMSSDQFAAIAAGRFGATTACYYTMRDNTILLSRALSSETVEAEWVRKSWLINGSTYKARATADDDVCLFPEWLMTRAIVWRMKRATGLQYQDEMTEWEADLAMHLRQDRGVTA
jgi:hypothetical protein